MCSAVRPNLSRSLTSPRGLWLVVKKKKKQGEVTELSRPSMDSDLGIDTAEGLTHRQRRLLPPVLAVPYHHLSAGGCCTRVDFGYGLVELFAPL